jgi:hypothetical protein
MTWVEPYAEILGPGSMYQFLQDLPLESLLLIARFLLEAISGTRCLRYLGQPQKLRSSPKHQHSPLESPLAKHSGSRTTEQSLVLYYLGAPALFQSITLTRFQWFFLSWNSSWPSLLMMS